ncbi:MAG: serine hydrolase [Eubacterium sp.]|nr:serine hydrolase [Eubacterium sp.]
MEEIILTVPEEVGMSSAGLSYIDGVMERAIREKVKKGMVTLVARHGKIIQFKAYGQAREGVPMKKNCIFRLASMTKPIGGVALMQLFDQGKVMPSDLLSEYIPAFADVKVAEEGKDGSIILREPERQISIHDLMTMRSGITAVARLAEDHPGARYCAGRYKEAGIIDTMHPLSETLADVVDKLAGLPIASDPGSRWDYSNLSSDVCGRIVELVSGLDFNTYINRYIFEPLGMRETAFYPDEKLWDRIPAVHACGSLEELKELDTPGTDDTRLPFASEKRYYNPAAGLCGTAWDYYKFAQMLANKGTYNNHRILSPNSVHLMTQNHIGEERTFLYGHGWGYMMNVEVDYNTVFNYMGTGSYGWHGYWGSVFNVWPEKDLVAIFLSQCSPVGPSWKVQERFLNVVANAVL